MIRAIIILLLLGVTQTAWTDDGSIDRLRTKKGDTLQLLAAEYYGNRKHKIYIMVENDLDHDVQLPPGTKLNIPISQEVTSSSGDTLESLAEAHLGDKKRADFLAQFNQLNKDASIAAGQNIRVPMRVTYRAAQHTKLRDVSLSLFATPKKANFLKKYNFLKSETLEPGESIVVPILDVQTQLAKRPPQDQESAARAETRANMTAEALRQLPYAESMWRQGKFSEVKKSLISIDTEYLDSELSAEVGILLGSTYVAFDDEESALDKFTRVIKRNPSMTLKKRKHSKKVRSVWEKAKTSMQPKAADEDL